MSLSAPIVPRSLIVAVAVVTLVATAAVAGRNLYIGASTVKTHLERVA